MIDCNDCDPRVLDEVTTVVDALSRRVSVNPEQILLVGAVARDVLHSAFGHSFSLRGTTDTDIGLAVGDWRLWEGIDKSFPRAGINGIRYLIDGLPVDVMPFGGVEDPDGIVHPARRSDSLVVFGFQDVYAKAQRLTLPSGATIRIPQPAGYAMLKMRSWVDRSIDHEYKDGPDLALATYWYRESGAVVDRLYDSEAGLEVLVDCDWDLELAAARLLGVDAAGQLSAKNANDLQRRWLATDFETLARHFLLPGAAKRRTTIERRRSVISQLSVRGGRA